jgi:hypothetical protein
MISRLYRRPARAAARLLHPLAAAALLLALAAPAAAQTKPCVAPLGWWESKGLEPFFINPKGNAPTTDCDFELWSWSALVHFMQPDPKTGAPMFLLLPTYDDLVPDKTGGLTAKPEALLKTRELTLRPRNEQPKSLGSFQQAGPGGVLVDQNGRSVYSRTWTRSISISRRPISVRTITRKPYRR